MKQYGLIGFPLSHSFSKKYFDNKFKKEQIKNASFSLYEMEDISNLPKLLESNKGIKGICITIPHKKNVISFLHWQDNAVQQIGACNCIRVEDGKLYGYNTDILGFKLSFEKHLLPHHTKALILGTGGASAGIEYVLKKLNITYLIVSRTNTIDAKSITYDQLTPTLLAEYKIVINCTPLGTFPNIDSCPTLQYQSVTSEHYFYDLVYNPAETKFLTLAKERGAIIQNGYEMLILQAEENWKIWNE